MNILKLTATAIATIALCTSVFAGETIDKIKSTSTLNIGARPSSIPYSFTNERGSFDGYSQDLSSEFKRFLEGKYKLSLSVNKIEVSGATRQPLVVNKVIDAEFGSTSYTDERAKVVNFMIIDADPVVPAVKSADNSITSIESLKGKKVAVISGTTGEKILRRLNAEKAYGVTIILAKDYPQSFLMMSQGRADAVVTNKVLLAGEIAKTKSTEFKVLPNVIVGEAELIGVMYGKQDPEFTADVKEFEAKVKGDGTLDRLYTKWFGPLNLKWTGEQRKAVFAK